MHVISLSKKETSWHECQLLVFDVKGLLCEVEHLKFDRKRKPLIH